MEKEKVMLHKEEKKQKEGLRKYGNKKTKWWYENKQYPVTMVTLITIGENCDCYYELRW